MLVPSKKKKIKHIPADYKLETAIRRFANKLENKKVLDENLYNMILRKSIAYNKKEILDGMIEQIKIFEDYNEEEINFNYWPFLQKLKQINLD